MAVLPPDPVFNLRNAEMGPVNCICFHQSQRLFCGTAKGVIYLWDLQTNRTPLHFTVGSAALTYVDHQNDALLTQQKGGIIQSWTLDNSRYILNSTLDTEHMGFCRLACAPEQNLIFSPKLDNSIAIIGCNDFQIRQTLTPATNNSNTNLGHIFCLKPVQFSGQLYLLAAYESGDFFTWDLRCGKVISSEKFDECPMALDYDPLTNRGIYGGPSDKLGVFVYDRGTMELQKKGEIGVKNAGINCVCIRKDQKVFSTGGWDGRIRIFSWKSLRPLAVLTDHKASVMEVTYSSDKVPLWKAPIMAACGLDGQISLWDLYN